MTFFWPAQSTGIHLPSNSYVTIPLAKSLKPAVVYTLAYQTLSFLSSIPGFGCVSTRSQAQGQGRVTAAGPPVASRLTEGCFCRKLEGGQF